jgi:hypothetical protein
MFRTLSRSLSRVTSRKSSSDDEFVSCDAAQVERQAKEAAAQRSKKRDEQYKKPPSDFDGYLTGDEESFYRGSTLEALCLEPIMQATCHPVAFGVPGVYLPPSSQIDGSTRTQTFLQAPQRAAQVRETLKREPVLLRREPPDIVVTPTEERTDPLEVLDQLSPLPSRVTRPQRPPMRRNAISYRDDRELPLRVQAIRRSHQEIMARELSARPLLQGVTRRASEPFAKGRNPEQVPASESSRERSMSRGRPGARRNESQAEVHPAQRTSSSRRPPISRSASAPYVPQYNEELPLPQALPSRPRRPPMPGRASTSRSDYSTASRSHSRDHYIEAAEQEFWTLTDAKSPYY